MCIAQLFQLTPADEKRRARRRESNRRAAAKCRIKKKETAKQREEVCNTSITSTMC